MGAIPVCIAWGLRVRRFSFFYLTESPSLARLVAALIVSCQVPATSALEATQAPIPPAANVHAVEPGPTAFVDLANHPAAAPAINSMVAQGIMRGVSQTQFAPDASYSLGEFMLSMQHMFKLTAPARPINFPDVPRDSPIYAAVEAVTPFMDRGLFCPGCALGTNFIARQPVMRAVVATILVNILKAENKILLVSPAEAESVLANVSDASSLPPTARTIFATALKSEIIALEPGNNINLGYQPTRAHTAVLLDAVQKNFNIPPVRPAP
jgi:hypothetical protein